MAANKSGGILTSDVITKVHFEALAHLVSILDKF